MGVRVVFSFGKLAATVVATFACLAAFSQVSGAATVQTEYMAGSAGAFDSTGGGWIGESDGGPECGPGGLYTCHPMTVSFPSEGSPPNHRVRVEIPASYIGPMPVLFPDARLIGPIFKYEGAGGKAAESLSFKMKIRDAVPFFPPVDVDPPLPMPTGVYYQVGVVDLTANESTGTPGGTKLISKTLLTDRDQWAEAPANLLDPDALTIGHHYRVVVWLNIFGAGPDGVVEFDDVSLTATATKSDDPGPGPGPGDGDGDGDGEGPKPGTVLPPPKVIPPGVAYLYKNHLFIRIRCPRAFKPKCKVQAVALTKRKKGKQMTKVLNKTVKPGTWTKGDLLIKKKFRKTVDRFSKTPSRRTLTVRLRTRSKLGKKNEVFYRLRVKTRTASTRK